jgi:hypothetical protein
LGGGGFCLASACRCASWACRFSAAGGGGGVCFGLGGGTCTFLLLLTLDAFIYDLPCYVSMKKVTYLNQYKESPFIDIGWFGDYFNDF